MYFPVVVVQCGTAPPTTPDPMAMWAPEIVGSDEFQAVQSCSLNSSTLHHTPIKLARPSMFVFVWQCLKIWCKDNFDVILKTSQTHGSQTINKKHPKTKFLVIILNVIMCRWCYQLLTQTFCPQGRVLKMSTCSLLPLRKIRDWIGKDPDLRENTQQIVEGLDLGGIERSKWIGLLSRSASMDGRKRGGAKTQKREPLKVHAFFGDHQRVNMSCVFFG